MIELDYPAHGGKSSTKIIDGPMVDCESILFSSDGPNAYTFLWKQDCRDTIGISKLSHNFIWRFKWMLALDHDIDSLALVAKMFP